MKTGNYEDQLIREATGEGLPSFSEVHEDYFDETLEAEDREVTNETGDQQGENMKTNYIEGDGTNMQIYVRSMGKLLAVTAIFISDEDANAYCERHNDEGVVAQGGGLVFTANLYDRGTHAELPQTNDKTRLFTHALNTTP